MAPAEHARGMPASPRHRSAVLALACAWLDSLRFSHAESAHQFFAQQRTNDGKGVTDASQKRSPALLLTARLRHALPPRLSSSPASGSFLAFLPALLCRVRDRPQARSLVVLVSYVHYYDRYLCRHRPQKAVGALASSRATTRRLAPVISFGLCCCVCLRDSIFLFDPVQAVAVSGVMHFCLCPSRALQMTWFGVAEPC